ncbi:MULTISPECIES: hypothetical protein [unclassified Sporosarcina]|uniref:hypothetical protein n=1 Tax=unclassified Sporosarcina TaxID=2647733 RepID=UPI00203C4E50|nr:MULTISPECIES: hypothetical protein [unclassified Sporosarcina]GKV64861.1 hypothetical protein NCCP2331_10140 [Sporosarcina sp. NCCP-2331]GLB54971.1 hypothetical protein NCCP2378_07560 [Sporosarcina sp. NCCP-2378]
MELIFQQQKITLDNATADHIIKQINNLLAKDYYLSHFIADGIEVYENHESYLNEHAREIEELEIIAKTVKGFVNDLLLSAEEYTQRAIPELAPLAEAFYDNPQPETWTTLDQLLGGLQWINEMLMTIGKSMAVPSNWQGYLAVSDKMQEDIQSLAEAIENEDNVLIGDIIQYELLPNFEELEKEIQLTMDNEGLRHDLN